MYSSHCINMFLSKVQINLFYSSAIVARIKWHTHGLHVRSVVIVVLRLSSIIFILLFSRRQISHSMVIWLIIWRIVFQWDLSFDIDSISVSRKPTSLPCKCSLGEIKSNPLMPISESTMIGGYWKENIERIFNSIVNHLNKLYLEEDILLAFSRRLLLIVMVVQLFHQDLRTHESSKKRQTLNIR